MSGRWPGYVLRRSSPGGIMEEEAPVVVTAATGALGPVVANLSTLLRRDRDGEYKLRRGTRKDIKHIRSKLKSIHSILWGIWEKEKLDAEGKELRMEAWRLADDMNDAIDDFILSLEHSNNGRRLVQPKIQPSRPFKDLKERADDLSERCRKQWKMETAHTTVLSSLCSRTKSIADSAPAKRPRVVDPYVHKDASELVGMKKPMDKIIKYLLFGKEDYYTSQIGKPRDEFINHLDVKEEYTPELKMACIVGAAGMGKTTLAHLVYEAIKEQYDACAFVSVISSRNMTEVLTSILQQVAPQSIPVPPAATNKPAAIEKHLVDGISNSLKDKRYLVIIDDVWRCEEWKAINKCLPDNNLGSGIVTTCRFKSIAEMWREDFDALVYDFKNVGFSKMYHRTPLAVACLISAVAKERERQEEQGLRVARTDRLQDRLEEQVMRNGIQNTPGFEPLVESLELGYKDLPHHMLKTCLLYCSIYPEDYIFRRNDLIRRWIAEGFVCKEETAEYYFDELVTRGLMEDDSDIDLSPADYGYTVHPTMRNYLRGKLREDNFITCTSDGIPSSPVGRLCIDGWLPTRSDAVDPLSGIDWHRIRSLVVFGYAKRVPYKHLKHLRVLDVQQYFIPHRRMSYPVLENQHLKIVCGTMLRLRHLLLADGLPMDNTVELGRLQWEGITEIPTEIARLQHLETLDVRTTGITRLPAEIAELKQLKTLSLSWNKWLSELPKDVGNLQHLEICGSDHLREQACWEIIRTLKKLRTLYVGHNRFLSRIPRDIGELQQLKTLDVRDTGITEVPREIGKLHHLKTLDLSSTRITELPCEIENLHLLEALYLRDTQITNLPQNIGKLHHLEILDLNLSVWKLPRQILKLKKLKFLNASFRQLPFEAAQLSKLEWLPRCVRRAWKNIDVVSSLAGEILSFTEAHVYGGDGGLIVDSKHVHIPQWIKEHFNNIGSLDIRICKLEEQDLKILREMPYLESLRLRFEGVPRKPIVITSEGFEVLASLSIDSRVPRITFQEGAMPRLCYLYFHFQFYGGPPNTDPPMGIKHLVRLENVTFRCNEWYRADSPCISAKIDVTRKEASVHRNEITLKVPGKDAETVPKKRITQSSEDHNEACSSSGAQEIDEIHA